MNEANHNLMQMINIYLDEIVDDCHAKIDREELIEMLDDACDCVFVDYVDCVPIAEYNLDMLLDTSGACSEIIKYAEEVAWVEDDSGLWEGMTYGVLAAIAFGSLRNCFYQLMANRGYDSNNDLPFENKAVFTRIQSCPECRRVLSDYHDPYCSKRSETQPFVTEYHCAESSKS